MESGRKNNNHEADYRSFDKFGAKLEACIREPNGA